MARCAAGVTTDDARTTELRAPLAPATRALPPAEGAPAAAFQSAIERMQAAGAKVERREMPMMADAFALTPLLYAPEAYVFSPRL